MEQSIEQLQSLRVIEHLDVIIFSVERGMPASPTAIATVKQLYDVIVREYNETYAKPDEIQKEIKLEIPENPEQN
jgi:hypothetical protein